MVASAEHGPSMVASAEHGARNQTDGLAMMQSMDTQVLGGADAALMAKGKFGARAEPTLKPLKRPQELGKLKSRDEMLASGDAEEVGVLSVEEMFRVLDADNSNGLDMAELGALVEILGLEMTEEQLQGMLMENLNSEALEGAEAELDSDGFKLLIEPIILEQEAAEAARAEAAAAGKGEVASDSADHFDPRALGCLPPDNPMRAALLQLVHKPSFDYFVLLLIGCNAVMMALEDPQKDPDNPTELELKMAYFEAIFNIMFTFEMSLKMVALGVVRGPHTYLQSSWNLLDFVVVVTAWLPYILPDSSSKGGAVRAFRLLRPLRTINRFPGLKRLVTTILMSIPQMQVLAIMVLLYTFTFAVVAVQLWQGVMLQRCHTSVDSRVTEECTPGEGVICEDLQKQMMVADNSAFCDMAATNKGLLWEGKSCPTKGDFCEMHDVNPYNDILSFDSFGSACIPVLQMATVSSWQEVMHIMQDVTGEISTIYFIFGTVFGGYFLFNLFVAVLKSKFEIAMAVAAEGSAVFALVDTDGGGELDEDELKQVLNSKGVFLTDERLTEVFHEVDKDGGGSIDVEEFTDWLRGDSTLAAQMRERMDVGKSRAGGDSGKDDAIHAALPIVDRIKLKLRALQPDNDWNNLFNYYDLDGDGAIEVDEFRVILRRDLLMRADVVSDEGIAEVFAGIDENGGGDVDADEFAIWVTQESFAIHWVKMQEAIRVRGIDGLSELIVERGGLVSGATDGAADVSVFDNEGAESPERERERGVEAWKVNLRMAIRSRPFQLFVVACVTFNSLALALDHHEIDSDLDEKLQVTNVLFTVVFVLEIMLKMIAFNRKEFFSNAGWKLDLLMAFAGLIDLMALMGIDTDKLAKALPFDVFVLCRVVRPLRLVYTVPTLEPVYRVCVKVFAGLVYIVSLAGLFMFIFSVLGMQIFGGQFDQFEHKPRAHYDTFTMAFTTTFQVMTFDSWQVVMYDGIRAVGGASAFYFVTWVVVGSMVMLNLLLVIILDVYTQSKQEVSSEQNGNKSPTSSKDDNDNDDEFSNPMQQAAQMQTVDFQHPVLSREGNDNAAFKSESVNSPNAASAFEEEVYDMNETAFVDRSCGIWGTDSGFRDVCRRISESKHTDHFILFLILANCVTMASDHPKVDPESDMRMALDVIDMFFTIIFTVEMCIHIVAIGFYKEKDAYLRGWWNRLDFTIVCVSWLDYLAAALEIKFLRTLRLLRALRALRMFNRLTGLKILIDSLLDSVIALGTIFGTTLLVFLSYAILGVTVFKGRFHRCIDDVGVAGIDTCIGSFVDGGAIQSKMWLRPHNNFDNVLHGMFTLFTVSTSNDWIITAQLAIDAPEFVGQQPIRENVPGRIVFFMLFIVIVNFFFLNLFIGVIYGKYVERSTAGMEDLSKEQKQWLDMLRQLTFAKPQKDIKTIVASKHVTHSTHLAPAGMDMPDMHAKEKAFTLVSHKMFDHFIVVCIIANCIMMAATYHGESQQWADMQALLNLVFTLIFTVEAFLKLYAFGFSIFFNDSWCRFDCFVVTGSWADLIFTWLGIDLFSSSLFRIIRISRVIGRIGRVFKLLGDNTSTLGLDEIMECLYQVLPQLGYIGILVGLILFIFAVLAMNLFGNLAQTGCIGPNTNFERAPRAALTLLGVATKDRITCTIHAAMVQEPYCSEADGTCGTPGLPQIFFLSFSLVIMFTTLEMFVNVVLQSFEDLSSAAGLPITLAHIEQFEDAWKKLDPMATGWIAQNDLKSLFDDLPPQVGMDTLADEGDFEPRFLRLIEMPNGDFSRYLLGETFEEVRDATTDVGVETRIKRIVAFVFDVPVRQRDQGLKAGEIMGVRAGAEVVVLDEIVELDDGASRTQSAKYSFVVSSNIKKGKEYQLLVDTEKERNEWVACISGELGATTKMSGTLLKLGGRTKTQWEPSQFSATHGTLGWDSRDESDDEDDVSATRNGLSVSAHSNKSNGSNESELSLSAKKLHQQLSEISGLSKREVRRIVRMLDASSDDDDDGDDGADDDEEGDGGLDKDEFESGLITLNEQRLAGNVPEGRPNEAMMKLIMGQLNFYEVLFAVCERKTGKPLPNTNFACREAKISVGVRMPSIKARVSAAIKEARLSKTPALHAALEKGGAGDQLA